MKRGVTLVELIVATTIILFVSMACIQILQSNSHESVSTLKRIQASQILDEIHNHLRRSDIAKLEDNYRQFPQIITNGDFSAEAQIEKAATDGSRKALITVHWTSDKSDLSISEDVTLSSL